VLDDTPRMPPERSPYSRAGEGEDAPPDGMGSSVVFISNVFFSDWDDPPFVGTNTPDLTSSTPFMLSDIAIHIRGTKRAPHAEPSS
jgi:hypothetical protein